MLLLFGFFIGAQLNAATVFTDKTDYPPDDTVLITGTDFWANETVTVQVTHYDGNTPATPDYDPWNTVANSYGIFDTYWVVPEDALSETLLVTAQGQTSGLIATTIFADANTILVPLTNMEDPFCPGDSFEYCVALYQRCPRNVYEPLPNRPILFFINDGTCGVDVSQEADDTVWTDENGVACFNTVLPDNEDPYTIRVKFRGEDKPYSYEPPNSACDPTERVALSTANVCEDVVLDYSSPACGGIPPVATCPGDTSVFLCSLGSVCIPGFGAADPDGDLESIVVSLGTLSSGTVCFTPTGAGSYTITLIATDSTGLADTCETVVTVALNNAPVCSLPSGGSYFICGDTTFSFPVSATDVDGNLVGCTKTSGPGTLSGGNWTFTTTGPGVYSAGLTCTDACGAACSGTVNITVTYNNAPVCNLPADGSYFVCGDTTFSFPVSATDVNGNLVGCTKTTGPGTLSGGNWTFTTTGPGVYSAGFICTDACGAACSGTVNITVNYNSAPVITCPANISVECNASTDPSNTGSPTVTDDNDPTPVVAYSDSETAGSCPQEKTITRTWTATDNCGAVSQCQQIITVEDNTAPVITCPANITIECNESTDPTSTGSATAVDNCDPAPVVAFSDVANNGTITRTWTATDACGNSSQCTQTITIDDTTQPVITCPANVTIACDASTDPSNTGSATATDNCDANSVITYTDSETAGSCPQEKTITRTWKATDDAGNFATCQQVITVEDNIAPVITCPATATVECDGSIDPSVTGLATAVDNCDASPQITYSDNNFGDTITRTWIATDACGNSSSCQQLIIFEDTTSPVLVSCPPDLTIQCDQSLAPSITGMATASDNCDPSPVVTFTDSETPGGCPQEKTITRTWIATDADGNSATICQQTITVIDTTPPAITCPANVEVECGQPTDPSSTGYATAIDNCDPSPIITYSDTRNNGVTTRLWTATDACGNSAQCTQTITVDDTTPPVITCPANVTIACDASTVPPNTGSATATDNCDTSPSITYTDSETAGSCPQEKTITRTWTATDAGGSGSSCQQVITVVDDTAPVITCPADVTIECDESIEPSNTGMATAVDNCDSAPALTYSDVDNGGNIVRTWTATDACGNSSSCQQLINFEDTTPPVLVSCPPDMTIQCDQSSAPSSTGQATSEDNCDPNPVVTYSDSETPGDCPQEKTISRTWIATDADGNSATICQQTITIVDTTPPAITCPASVEVECGQPNDPDHTGYATAVDNCDPSPIITFSDTRNNGVTTRLWTATDACGNSAQCTQTITVDDGTPPVITCPASITVECGTSTDPANTGSATATDNCDQNPAITKTDSESAGSCPQEKVITRTWKATDGSGNFAECQQTITVVDTTPPVITCPGAYVVGCSGSTDPGVTGNPTISDNCDPSPIVSYTDSLSGTTIIRKWTAADHCDNAAFCLQTITQAQNSPPVATCPGNTTMFLCALTDTALAGFTYSDPDDNIATIDLAGGTLDGNIARFTPVEGVNILTLIVQDECGEVDSCTTEVLVTLNNPPYAGVDFDTTVFKCTREEICLTGFGCTDSDDNLASCYAVGGVLSGGVICFTPNNGVNVIKLIAVDECGAADTALITVNAILNNAPFVTCPGFQTENVFELPAEICVTGFGCSDPDGNLTNCSVTVTDGDGSISGTFDGNSVCFTADAMGMYTIMLTATDQCGATSSCFTEVFVKKVSSCPIVRIEKTHNTFQGYFENVSITIENSTYDFEGFDFLIAYDASALSAVSVTAGAWIEDCEWEYFTYRFGVNGNCGSACPSGLLRIVAIAEMNNGAHSPLCYGPPDGAEYELAVMRFLVTNDRTFECQYVPISFFWNDCGDNAISGMNGEILYVNNIVYDFLGNVIWDEEDDVNYPEGNRIPYIGAPDLCLNPDPLKPSAVRCIEFVFGGVDIICADSIDAPGDLNLNGVANEIADAVVFTNYFVYGTKAFNVNVEGQRAASDVNGDGVILTVSDLVYLIRIICGDALPLPKVAPHVKAEFSIQNGVVSVEKPLGAAHIVIKGNAKVVLGKDVSHMEMAYNFDGVNTNVLIYSFTQDYSFSGEILVTDGEVVSIDAADYDGIACQAKFLPATFSLTGYPNPFNPVTNIEMNMPVAADWTIDIYNVAGRKIAEFSGHNEAGTVKIQWDASDQASGIYFFKAEAGQYSASRKMLLLK